MTGLSDKNTQMEHSLQNGKNQDIRNSVAWHV